MEDDWKCPTCGGHKFAHRRIYGKDGCRGNQPSASSSGMCRVGPGDVQCTKCEAIVHGVRMGLCYKCGNQNEVPGPIPGEYPGGPAAAPGGAVPPSYTRAIRGAQPGQISRAGGNSSLAAWTARSLEGNDA
eukprot:11200342-Heterocapsa_arctica.AAC.1